MENRQTNAYMPRNEAKQQIINDLIRIQGKIIEWAIINRVQLTLFERYIR